MIITKGTQSWLASPQGDANYTADGRDLKPPAMSRVTLQYVTPLHLQTPLRRLLATLIPLIGMHTSTSVFVVQRVWYRDDIQDEDIDHMEHSPRRRQLNQPQLHDPWGPVAWLHGGDKHEFVSENVHSTKCECPHIF